GSPRIGAVRAHGAAAAGKSHVDSRAGWVAREERGRRRNPGGWPLLGGARLRPIRLRLFRVVRWLGAALCLVAPAGGVWAQPTTPPPYHIVRHDEDYGYLSDPARRSDWLDPIKYIALSDARPGFYLSLGGEIRQRFELFDNTDWKPLPADGFLLQKYMLSADLHLGSPVRFFVNFKSGLEDGRT